MESSARGLLAPESVKINLTEAPTPATAFGKAAAPWSRLLGYAGAWQLLLSLVLLGCCFCWGLQPSWADTLPSIVSEFHQGAKGRDGDNSYGVYAVAENGSSGEVSLPVSSIDPSGILFSPGPIVATNAIGIYGESIGGKGGSGGDAYGLYGEGGNGGKGGDSGHVDIKNQYSITTSGDNAIGIYGSSYAGNGGGGGDAIGVYATGGDGAVGGNAGPVAIENRDDGRIVTEGAKAHGIFAQSIGGHGGSGGSGGGIWGGGGCGSGAGDGGTVEVINYQTITTKGNAAHNIFAQSVGGYAGDGGSGSGLIGYGGDSNSGGDGNAVQVQSYANLVTQGNGSDAIHAQSIGGGGGSASLGAGLVALGGNGGAGGYGGTVEVINQGLIQASGANTHGIFAQSVGGGGGDASLAAGLVAIGGKSSRGGYASSVKVTNSGGIQASANAILAQSVGGGGGSGSLAVGAVAIGGSGSGGGSGGVVEVTHTGDLTTSENNSSAILAQSVGGGGGNGGSAVSAGAWVSIAIGGGAAQGGSGSAVTVNNNQGGSIRTQGDNSHGIEAQSIGGGGGNGGFSVAGSVGYYFSTSMALGGYGGNGGSAGGVAVNNATDITTAGANADGILAQSVGGGGGNGGFSVAGSLSNGVSIALSWGGTGGKGGNGGTVSVASAVGKTITTTKDNSLGVLAQSIGGGGGSGGFSVGGSGGTGGKGGTVTAKTSGTIGTSGNNAVGVLAQSVGGGGGSGGFSTSLALGKSVALSFSLGGSGGSGNDGGQVSLTSYSTINTQGADAKGILAQSIGGGGGNGGFSATGSFTAPGKSLSVGMSIGGSGGGGGDANTVAVSSLGSTITTQGSHAAGVQVQSIGGGGGDGNFSLSLAEGGYAFAFADVPVLNLGSKGGAGGKGGQVSLQNTSSISTQGEFSDGILAQSIGGGGGAGSYRITGELSLPGEKNFGLKLGASGVAGSGGGDAQKVIINDYLAYGVTQKTIATVGDNSNGIAAQSIGAGGGKGGFAFSLSINADEGLLPGMALAFGGDGGAGGAAGDVEVSSKSNIATQGENSRGILAQSIGGGGGDGGMAVAVSIKAKPAKVPVSSISAAMGGKGGSGNKAGKVTVSSSGAQIITAGNSAAGIQAQSVGGGGGSGGGSISVGFGYSGAKSGTALGLSLGGDGGSGGSAGAVTVTSASSIKTGSINSSQEFLAGNDASGIIAQSVGGGGGSGGYSIAGLFNGGSSKDNHSFAFSLGGSGGSGNTGGAVSITETGATIQTLGDRSAGLLAQSVGGGGGSGGFSIAADLNYGTKQTLNVTMSVSIGGNGGSGGNAGAVTVANSSSISTGWTDTNGVHGHDSAGIVAQSIGGGGGNGGFSIDGAVTLSTALTASIGGSGGGSGNGQAVTITNIGAGIITQGDRSAGIVGQSVGGGGGSGGFSITGTLSALSLTGSLGGTGGSGGTGGAVRIETLSAIQTHGQDSQGILAQSIGGGGGSSGYSAAALVSAAGLGLSLGGKGSGGGDGNTVTVIDGGSLIETAGKRSAGIQAQSIGGGGGSSGFGVSGGVGLIKSISLGGDFGVSGNGKEVVVQSSSSITTKDDDSPAILAQSIGAGGGVGSINVAESNVANKVALGAQNQAKGDGGAVAVTTTGTSITTGGSRSAGIVAQSIGAGGGVGSAGASTSSGSPQVILGASYSSGNGGKVSIDNSCAIAVTGLGSHGIVAQSIGGGGGMASNTGQKVINATLGGSNNTSGNGGEVSVTNRGNLNITATAGCGIVAQSIGGGGGLVNHTSAASPGLFTEGTDTQQGDGASSGNSNTVAIHNIGNITTKGDSCIGIAAQSLSGGGGLNLSSGKGGSAGGGGNAGIISISHNGAIDMTGKGSVGILAQSAAGQGTGGNVYIVLVDHSSIKVQGDNSTGLKALSSGAAGSGKVSLEIMKWVTVEASDSGNRTAVGLDLGGSDVTIWNNGEIKSSGSALRTTDSTNFTFNNWGTINAYDLTIKNSSTLNHVSGEIRVGLLEIVKQGGLLRQTGGVTQVAGNLSVNADTNSQYTSTYALTGGTITAGNILVGSQEGGSKGQFIQSGGSNTMGTLYLGNNQGGGQNEGYYYLNGGNFKARDIKSERGGHFVQNSGTMSCDNFIISAGGEFIGNGFMEGVVNNSGVFHLTTSTQAGVSAQAGSTAGTLNLSGSFSNDIGGTLVTDIASATTYGRLAVGGLHGLPGTVQLAMDAPDILEPRLLGTFRPRGNQVFPDIITCDGTLTGRFDQIANQQISGTLFWQARYNPTSVDLWVQRNYTNSSLGLTRNRWSVGNMLNSVASTASGDLDNVLNAIDYLPTQGAVANAYTQISPEKAGALASLGLTGARFQMRNLAEFVTNGRFGTRAVQSAFGLDSLGNSGISGAGLMLAYNGSSLAQLLSGSKAGTGASPWGFYLLPNLLLGAQASTLNQTGYAFTGAGFTLGGDFRVKDDLLVGVATGYNHVGASFHGSGGSIENNNWPITAYAAYLPQSFYAFGSLGYSLNLFTLNRNISFEGVSRRAKSSPAGHQFNGYGEAGYDLKWQRLVVTPFASLAYSQIWVNGFQEDGANSLNLQVNSQSASSLQTGVGAKISLPIKRGPTLVVPQVYASYQHEFADDSRGLDARLSQGSSTFTWLTEAPRRDYAVVGTNITLGIRKNVRAQLDYNVEVGRTTSTNHSLTAGLRWEF